jgi:hypothetical protein
MRAIMPPKEERNALEEIVMGLAGILLGLAVSVILYLTACTISFLVTRGGQDPTNFMVVIFGWIPSLILGIPLGLIGGFKMSPPPTSRD